MGETRLIVDGLGFPESTRWHDGRVWLCNWGSGEVLAVRTDGEREVMARLAPQTLRGPRSSRGRQRQQSAPAKANQRMRPTPNFRAELDLPRVRTKPGARTVGLRPVGA